MNNVLYLPKALFRNLVLKPLDFLLFNGSGVLYLSRDELRETHLLKGPMATHEAGESDESIIRQRHGFPNYGLPDVQYGPWGKGFNFPPGGWADRG